MIDLKAVAVAMGATVNTKTITEIVFPKGPTFILELLQNMDERAAMQKLTSAIPGSTSGPILR